MFKGVSFILGTLIFASVASAQASEKECKKETPLEKNLSELEEVTEKVKECPAPTKDQFSKLCRNLYDKEPYDGPGAFGYAYQENLWDISCAKSTDTLDVAKVKIQAMWNKHRENFRCYNTSSAANEKNIAKYSIDSGFTVFISEAVKKYNLDMNFKDPADNKTVLDFLKDEETSIANSPPVNHDKISEYRRLYKMLESAGAKQAKDL